jgi:long-subunit fatty acid transport protein
MEHSNSIPGSGLPAHRTSMRAWAAALALLPCLALPAASGELVALGKKTGVGARAISLGEAFTAVADDYSALYYNAAGMTQLSKSEVGVNLGYGYFENTSSLQGGSPSKRSLESTKLNALNIVLTDGGRWALGLGYYVPISFDDPLYYSANNREYYYNAQGQMDHYRMGLAYMASEEVRLGLAVSAISGREQLEVQDGVTVRYLEEYTGYNLEPSFLIHLSEQFSLGGSAVVMEQLQLTDTYQEQGRSPLESDYDIHHPFQCRLGLAFQSGFTQISADWHGDYWSSYEYASAGDAFRAREIDYPNKHTLSVGLEQHLARKGPVLRGGYSWTNYDDRMPQPESFDPFQVNLGIGFIPSRRLGLDFAYQYGGSRTRQKSTPGGPEDLDIHQVDQQVMAALRYRW